jgi:hypothetical protein
VDEGAAGEAENGFGALAFGCGVAVKAVLVDGILDALGEVAFQFGGGDGDAVEEEDEIEAVFIGERVADLAGDA